MLEGLSDLYTSGFYARDSRARHAVSPAASSKTASHGGSQFSAVADVKSSDKTVVETSVGAGSTRKEVKARRVDLHGYRTKKV